MSANSELCDFPIRWDRGLGVVILSPRRDVLDGHLFSPHHSRSSSFSIQFDAETSREKRFTFFYGLRLKLGDFTARQLTTLR